MHIVVVVIVVVVVVVVISIIISSSRRPTILYKSVSLLYIARIFLKSLKSAAPEYESKS